jgi:hypothetical protein
LFLNDFMKNAWMRPAAEGEPVRQLPWPAALLLDLLLLPALAGALLWVRHLQARILREGMPLTPPQRQLAAAVGVEAAQRVRIVVAPAIPMPLPVWARSAAQRAGWIAPHIVGMTLGHGIVLREDCRDDAGVLAHELAHVKQVERFGGIAGFLRRYLRECVWPGYPHGVLEREARAAERQGSMHASNVIPYAASAVGTRPGVQ